VPWLGQAGAARLHGLAAGFRQAHAALVEQHRVVLRRQRPPQLHGLPRDIADIFVLHAGNDQRRAGLVDEHAVGFIDDGVAQAAQVQLRCAGMARAQPLQAQRVLVLVVVQHDQVAQVVEHHCLVRAVDNVGLVGRPPRGDVHFRGHGGHAQAERLI
jgi:hypothetical protein